MTRPNHPRTLWIVFLLFCLGQATALSAQGFVIERFQVDLYLHRDGSFSVEENIRTNFSERKHGIRRQIPYRYQSQAVEGELAMNHFPGYSYTTPLDSIRVEGHVYQTVRESDFYNIRIGSGDSYVSGRVTYNIRYRVYGAINRFLKGDELYWNVNGNGWDVPAESVDISIHFPDKHTVEKADSRLYTGRKGSQESAASAESKPGTFSARTTRALEAYEGFTVILRLPKGYLQHEDPPLRVLAEKYVVNSLSTDVRLEPGGTALVTELIDLEIKSVVPLLERRVSSKFPYSWLSDHLDHGTTSLKMEHLGLEYIHDGVPNVAEVRQGESSGSYESFIMERNAQPGHQVYRLQYRVWEAMEFSLGEGRFYFPWLNHNFAEPIVKARISVSWPPGMKLDTARSQIVTSISDRLSQRIERDSIVLTGNGTLFKDFTANLAIVLHGQWMPRKIPMRLYSPEQYVQRYDLVVDVGENGSVNFDHQIALVNQTYHSDAKILVRDQYRSWLFEPGYVAPRPQLFGSDGSYLRYEMDHGGAEERGNDLWGPILRFPVHNGLEDPVADRLDYSYSLYGLIGKDSTGGKRLNFPLTESMEFASDSVHVMIKLPGNLLLDSSAVKLYAVSEVGPYAREVELEFAPGKVEATVDPGLYAGEKLILDMHLPEGAVGRSTWLELRMIRSNHPILLLPVVLFLILLVLWVIFGRDKPFTKVVQYYPPEDMTPTEAGLLIDDKLHNRDLLALIYYWGANGNLSITETETSDGKPDYTLRKLKALPSKARKYEKTLFEALFLGRNSIRVGKLKNQYYVYMRQARGQVEEWAQKRKYYMPGTRGFGKTLRYIGIAIAGVVGILAVYNLLFARPLADGNWGAVIGWGLSAVLLWVFGRVMPRHGAYGLKKYAELKGFMDFIKTAEKDRLRLLLDEDPAYFGLTLGYAIAMGQANDWVEKFGPLLSSPPSYYHSQSGDDFNTVIFNQVLSRQLYEMSRNFNSMPASSGGGSYSSGGSTSSYSSTSYTSSGSSGGSGFSGGGGYSGGGYGGGGGSSW